MKPDALKKWILLAASVALIAIWARNLLLILPSAADKTQLIRTSAGSPEDTHSGTDEVEARLVYDASGRDPFEIPRPKKPAATSQSSLPVISRQPSPIRASMVGIVWNKHSPQLVVYDSVRSELSVLKTSDSVNGYRVVSIAKDQVTLRSRDGKIVWSTAEQSAK